MRFHTQLFLGTSTLLVLVAFLPAALGFQFLPSVYLGLQKERLRQLADQIERDLAVASPAQVMNRVDFHGLNYAAIGDETELIADWQNPETPRRIGPERRLIGPPPLPPPDQWNLELGESHLDVHRAPGVGSKIMVYWGRMRAGGYVFLVLPVGETTSALQTASLFLTAAAAVGLVLAFGLSWFLSRRLTRPLDDLMAHARQLERLDLDKDVPSRGSAEFDQLGVHLSRMAHTLSATLAQLEQANRHLASELQRRETMDELRREFIASASHELKTPIALIRGYAEGLSQGVADTAEARAQYLEVILDEAMRLDRHVQDLLELSLWESGRRPLRYERVDLAAMVRRMAGRWDPRFREAGLELTLDLPPQLEMLAEPESLEQTLVNFLTNAIDHGNNGGTVTIAVHTKGFRARLEVSNPGGPLTDVARARVWESYYKTDGSRQRKFGGAGLGLAIVKAIVNEHNGVCGCGNEGGAAGPRVVFWWEIPLQPSRHDVAETVRR